MYVTYVMFATEWSYQKLCFGQTFLFVRFLQDVSGQFTLGE